MKISKVFLAPTAALLITAASMLSCSANKQQSTVQSEPPRTETVIKQAPPVDTFEEQEKAKQAEKKNEVSWWEAVLGIVGGATIIGLFSKAIGPDIERMKNNPDEARIWLDMNGDNYLDP